LVGADGVLAAEHEFTKQSVNKNVAVSAPASAVQVASPLPEYPSWHFTATVPAVVLVPVPLALSLLATLIAAQVAAMQSVNKNVAVSAPASAVQVASPLPEYPLWHFTATVPAVVLVPVPLALSLLATLIAAQVAAKQSVNKNVAVSALASAVQIALPLPEYPSTHFTATVPVVVLVPVPRTPRLTSLASLSLLATSIEAQVAAVQPPKEVASVNVEEVPE